MNIRQARATIEAILESIPDSELPKFDSVDYREDGLPTVWFGGSGAHLGSARSGQTREPMIYRRRASMDAVQGEMTYRADRRLLDNGDDPTGVKLAKKGSRTAA